MTRTEQTIRTNLAAKGFCVMVGKRAFDIARKLEASGAIPAARYSFECFNANGPEFRSQWNNPKSRTAYEVSISL
jgi:hypothetical protein